MIHCAAPVGEAEGGGSWTQEHRQSHERGLRYPSDLTDAEWALVGALIPPARRGGRPRDVDIREVLNAVFYLLSTGCQRDALPQGRAAQEHRL